MATLTSLLKGKHSEADRAEVHTRAGFLSLTNFSYTGLSLYSIIYSDLKGKDALFPPSSTGDRISPSETDPASKYHLDSVKTKPNI